MNRMSKSLALSFLLVISNPLNHGAKAAFVDLVQLPSTVHLDSGGTDAQAAYDADFTTAYYASAGPGNGGQGVTVTSEHIFQFPAFIDTIEFRLRAHAYATGSYIRDHEVSYGIEYLTGGVWFPVPGASGGISGGDGDDTRDSGHVILNGLDLVAVDAVRATAHGFGNASGDEGNAGGDAQIFEIHALGIVPEPSSQSLVYFGLAPLALYAWCRRTRCRANLL